MRAHKPKFHSMLVLSTGIQIRHGGPRTPTNMCVLSVGFLLVLFSILPLGMGTGSSSCLPCHSLCTCTLVTGTTNQCNVDCSHQNFTSIPTSDLPNGSWLTVTLDLSYNLIEEVEVSDLSLLTNLQELYLQGNSIYYLPSGVFDINALHTLDVSSNPITEFPSNFFAASSSITSLNISHLQLKSIASDFLDELNHLVTLDMSGNQITSLSSGYFSSNNKLEYFNLCNNKISHIDSDAFRKQRKLKQLNLSGNSLSDLNATSLDTLVDLENLDISNNQLTYLDPTTISQLNDLTTLNLAGNPWNCSCELKDLRDILVQKENAGVTLVNRDAIVCTDKPDSTFLDFTDLDDFWCPGSYGSCIYDTEEQTFYPVTYSYSFTGTDVLNCTESCFDTNSTHAVLTTNNICLCGSILSGYSCYCNSKNYSNGENIQCTPTSGSGSVLTKTYVASPFEVLSGLTFDAISGLKSGSSSTFTVRVAIRTITRFEFSFGDRSATQTKTATSQQYTLAYTYPIPGTYNLTVGVYSTNLGYASATVPVEVYPNTSLVSSSLSCSPSYINYESAVSNAVKLEFEMAHNLEYNWTRSPDDGVQSTTDGGCGKWTFFRGRCLLLRTTANNYDNAVTDCATNLLTVQFAAELTEILTTFSTAGSILLDAKKNGSNYYWSTGRKAYFTVSDIIDSSLGDCVYVDVSNNDIKGTACSSSHTYVCQKETDPCPYGGSQYSGNSHCYSLVSTSSSWASASTACTTIYSEAHLAKIDSATLASFLLTLYGTVPLAWTGLNDRSVEGYLQWHDGTAATSGYPVISDSSTGDCGSMDSSGTWTMKSCATTQAFICEYSLLGVASVETYLTGIPDLDGTSYTLTEKESTTRPTDNQVVANIFPNMWINHDGVLWAWNFKTAVLTQSVTLALEVYEPQCSGGTSFTTPGCDGNGAKFGTCSVASSCSDRLSCSDTNEDYCYISQQCQPKMDPCNCNNRNDAFCSSDYQTSAPEYRLRGQTFVSLPAGASTILSVHTTGIAVKEHYILGFKTNSSTDVIYCDANTDLQDNSYQAILSGWMSSGDTLDKTLASWKQSTACFFQAVYAKRNELTVPTSLQYFTFPDSYTYTVTVPSLTQTSSCNLNAEEEVGIIEWITPTLKNVSGVEYIYVVHNVGLDLLFSISQGSQLVADWRFGTSDTQGTFISSCPAAVSAQYPVLCDANQYWPELPFAYKYRGFDYTAGATSSVEVTVRNDLSAQVTKLISVLIFMELTGLEIDLTTPNNDNMVAIGASTEFTVSMTTGSSSSFEYSINGSTISILATDTFSYTFAAREAYFVSVNASDLMFTGTANITVIARYRASVTDLVFGSGSSVLLINVLQSFTAQATINTGAFINITWNFGPLTRGSSMETTSTSLSLSESYTYTATGNYTLSLTVVDEFNDTVSKTKNIEIVEEIPSVTLSSSTTLSKKDDTVTVTATVPAPTSSYGNLLFTYDFNDGTTEHNTSQSQITHQFTSAGVYNVTVEAFNGASNRYSSVIVEVQEMITGLAISGDSIIRSNVSETYSVSKTTGTSLKYEFRIDALGISQSASSNNNFSVVIPSVGTFNITAIVTNDIDSRPTYFEVQVVTADTLQITSFTVEQYHAVSQVVTLEITILHHDTASLTVTWRFGDGNLTKGVALFNTTYTYTAAGDYTISVLVENSSVSNETSAEITIIEEISGANITDNGPGALNTSMNATIQLTGVVTAGTRLVYTWTVSGQTYSTGSSNTLSKVFTTAGSHQVCVNISNEVSHQSICKTLEIYAMIENLTISCTGCIQDSDGNSFVEESSSKTFVASILQGTTVTYNFDFGDSTTVAGTTNSQSHSYSVGNYTLYVTASNPVHTLKVGFPISVQSAITLVSFPSTMVNLGLVNSRFTLTVDVTGGSDINYKWKYCSNCSEVYSTSNEVYTPGYADKGYYTVSVTAYNMVSNASNTKTLIVVEEITSVTIASDLINGQYAVKSYAHTFSGVANTEYPDTYFQWKRTDTSGSYGSMTQAKNTTYTFSQTGQYTIECTATNYLTAAVSTLNVHVQETITSASITGNVSTVIGTDLGLHLSAAVSTGSDLRYEWSMEFSGVSTVLASTTASLEYSSSIKGNYTFYVNVSNDISWSNAVFEIQIMETIDNISITENIGSTSPYVGKDVAVTYSSNVNKGESYTITWEVMDSVSTVLTTTTGSSLTYSISASGTYTVTMTVTNQVSTKSKVFTVYVQVPVTTVTLSAAKVIVKSGESIAYTTTYNTDATHLTFSWIIDGTALASTGSTINYAFPNPGTFTISTTVNNNISSKNASISILVQDEIQNLAFTGCDTTAVEDTNVSVSTTMSSGTDVSFYWESSNGFSQSGSTFSVIFPNTGIYSLTLNASNLVGSEVLQCTLTIIGVISDLTIDVSSPPSWYFVSYNVIFMIGGNNLVGVTYNWTFTGPVNDTGQSTTNMFSKKFTTAGNYTATLVVYNSISSETKSIFFEILALTCSEPTVNAAGQGTRTIYKALSITFEALVALNGCSDYKIKYLWTVYSVSCSSSLTSTNAVSISSSVYTASTRLTLPGKSMDYGTFCVQLYTEYENTPLSKTITYTLTVTESTPVAIIAGGSTVTSPDSEDVVVDGSESFDPDGVTSGLTYSWSCSVSPNTSPSGCDDVTGSTTSSVTMAASKLQNGQTYTVQLTFSVPSRTSVSTTQTIIISSDDVPKVTIECISCRAKDDYVLSPGQMVMLEGNCTNCDLATATVSYQWTLTYDSTAFTLDSTSTSTTSQKSNLVIKGGQLPQASSYTVRLTVSKTEGGSSYTGYSETSYTGNSAPSSGSCSLSSMSHKALEDTVNFTCSGFTDAGSATTELYYKVMSYSEDSASSSESVVIYYGSSASGSINVAPWAGVSRNTVKIKIYVEDTHGASVVGFDNSVTINSPSYTGTKTAYIYDKVTSTLAALVLENNPTALLQYCISLTHEVNEESRLAALATSDPELATRTLIRNAITLASLGLPIESISEKEQVAFIMQHLMTYPGEYQTRESQSLVLTQIDEIKSSMKNIQGVDDNGVLTEFLIGTVSNLLTTANAAVYDASSVVNSTTELSSSLVAKYRPDISTSVISTSTLTESQHRETVVRGAFDKSVEIIAVTLQNQILGQESVEVTMEDLVVNGYRTSANAVMEDYNSNGLAVHMSNSTLNGIVGSSSEVLQVTLAIPQNPFTFGFNQNYLLTSKILSLSFQDTNAAPIQVSNLAAAQNILFYLPGNNTAGYAINSAGLSSSPGYNPLSEMTFSTLVVKKSGKKKAVLTTSTVSSGYSMHIMYRISLINDSTAVPTNQISFYLGKGYEASATSYEMKMDVTTADMTSGANHSQYTMFISASEFSPSASYSVTIINSDANFEYNVSVGVYFAVCQYYNTTTATWRTDGCSPTSESIATYTVCQCSHLTAFGGGMLVPPSAISFSDLTNLDFSTNPVVIITCSVVFVVYLVAVIVSRKLDLIDLERIATVPLCGKDGSFKYEVTVVTGRQGGSGTTAHVGVRLYGDYGKSNPRQLSKTGAFKRNCQDSFIIAHDTNLGNIQKLLIWHDNYGLDPSWYLVQVVVRDMQTEKRYYFFANFWMSLEMSNGFLQKELNAAGSAEITKFTRLFGNAVSNCMSDRHLWMSVMDRPAHSRFTRVQRATLCVTLLYTFMGVNAMWYGILKSSNDTTTDGWASFGWEEVVLALICNVMVLPISLLLGFIFKRSRSKGNVFEHGRRANTAESIEIDNDLSHYGGSLSTSTRDDMSCLDRESTTESFMHDNRTSQPIHRTKTLKTTRINDTAVKTPLDPTPGTSTDKSHTKLKRTNNPKMWNTDMMMDSWPDKQVYSKESIESAKKDSGARTQKVQEAADELMSYLDSVEKEYMSTEAAAISQNRQAKPLTRKQTGHPGRGWSEVDDIVQSDADLKSHKPVRRKVSTSTIGSGGKPMSSQSQKGFTPRQEANIVKPPSAGSNKVSKWVSKLRSTTSVDSIGAAKSALPEVEHIGPLEPDKGLAQRSNTFYSYEEMEEEQPPKEVKRSCSLPAWCVYVAYFLCFALSGTFIILVILYGHKFGADVALQWLLALLFSFIFSFLFIEPLKALALALYMSAIEKSSEDTDDVIDVEPTYDTSVERVKELSFKPLAGFALLRAKEDGQKVKRMRLMLRQFVAYMFYLVLVMALCYSKFPYSSFLFNESIENTFVRHNLPDSNYSFQNFTSIDEFWTWSQTVLVDGLHYSEISSYDEVSVLLGVARLRQVRGIIETCPVNGHSLHSGISSLTEGFSCKGSYGYKEDKNHYGDMWNDTQSQNLSWKYSTGGETGSKRRDGYIYSYGGGGYLQPLGETYNQTLTILQDLQSKDWIDLRTRAVFVDFTLYCPSEDLTTVLSLMVEFPLTGSVNTTYLIQTQRMHRYIDGIVDPLMICEILLFVVILYYAIHIIINMRDQGCSYLSEFWNWYEIISVLMATVAIGLYMGCVISATDKFREYFDNQYVFTNFEKVADIHTASRYLHAWLLFILMFKVVRQIRFIKVLHIYDKTIGEAIPKLFGTFLIFAILFLNHGMISYLFYGKSMSGFENYWTTLTSQIGMMRGTFNFFPLLFSEEIFTHIFLYSYTIFVYGLTVALIRAVLNDTYKTVKSQMYYKSTLDLQDYEMIDFMMKRFKLWAGIEKLKPELRAVHFEGIPSERCSTSQSYRSIGSDTGNASELFEIYERNHLSAADRLTHTWESVLKTLSRVEFLDSREEDMVNKTQKEIDDWKFNSRVRSYESDRQGLLSWKQNPSSNTRSTKGPHRTMTQKSLPGKSDGGATSLQPSSSAGGAKPAPPRGKRPASDGGRVSAEASSSQKPSSRERLSIYNFFKSIKPSKPAW